MKNEKLKFKKIFLAIFGVGIAALAVFYFAIVRNNVAAEMSKKFNQAPEIKSSYKLDKLSLIQPAEDENSVEVKLGETDAKEFVPNLELSKWDGEVSMKIKPAMSDVPGTSDINSLTFDGNKINYKTPQADYRFYDITPNNEHPEGAYEFEVILKEKPQSNIFSLDIETEGLDFFYQPSLTEEFKVGDRNGRVARVTETAVYDKSGKVITHRPENVVGSYAVYHKTKKDYIIGQKNYATGKAFHIYRPQIIDAQGNKVWGELNVDIVNNKLVITVSQDFLDKAVYPIIIDPTFGYGSIGGTQNQYLGVATESFVAKLGAASANGTLNYITWALKADQAGTTQAKTALYSDSSGKPNTRLGYDTNTFSFTNTNFDWATSTNNYNLAITSGAIYWAAIGNGGGSSNNIYVAYDEVSNYEGYFDNVTTPPATWTDFTYEPVTFARFSVYATYTAAASKTVINKPLTNFMNDDSLVGYWSFDGAATSWTSATAGTTNDLSGNNNTGTMTNMSRSASPVPGISGQALSFDGVNDYMNTASTMNFGGTKIITVSFWLKQNSYTNTDLLAMELSSNYNDNDGTFQINPNTSNPSGIFGSCIQDGVGVGGRYRCETFTRPSAGVWHHYGIILDNSTVTGDITAYVDGIAQTTTIGANDKDQSSNFKTDTLYFMNRGGTTLFNAGLIDEVRVYDRALGASEITDLYRLGASRLKVNTPTSGYLTSGLVGNWSFDGSATNWTSATAGTTNDLSGQGNTGTMTNMSRSSSPKPGISGQALSFDGSDDYVATPSIPYISTFSFSFWIKTTTTVTNAPVFYWGWYRYAVVNSSVFPSPNKIFFATGGDTAVVSSVSVNDGKWHHVGYFCRGSSHSLYVDGVLQDSQSTSLVGEGGGIYMGSGNDGGTPYYAGLVDEFHIYNRALSQSEIMELYNLGTRKVKFKQ